MEYPNERVLDKGQEVEDGSRSQNLLEEEE